MDTSKKMLLLIGSLFIVLTIYFAVDMMTRTVPPWQRKKNKVEQTDTDTLLIFSDTLLYEYKVRKDETLSGIAQNFQFSVAEIKALNELSGEQIREGQLLKIRARAVHTVAQGEMIETIARKYGVSSRQIIACNQISKPERLQVGYKLIIPRPLP